MVGTTPRSLSFAARFVAVTFALAVLGYLVVTAQQRANPPVDPAPETPIVVEPAGEASRAGETFLESSKVLVIDDDLMPADSAAEVAAPPEDPAFLFGSKSLVISPDALDPSGNSAPALLPSSTIDALLETATSAPAERAPEFLPSSKAKVPMPVGSHGTTAKSKGSGQVFLPSSKSFRMRESPAPAPPAKTPPVEPPEEP